MATPTRSRKTRAAARPRPIDTGPGEPRIAKGSKSSLPGQVVLVLQGGGALGAYQVGVYQALHEAGIEPDWVIGTSIGAINAALICGNPPKHRLAHLNAFWQQLEQQGLAASAFDPLGVGAMLGAMTTVLRGIPSFFVPNPRAWRGTRATSSVEEAAYYSTAPLRETLRGLIDWDYLCDCKTRLTVGAVNVCSGRMRYFDTREEPLGADHVMASGALPPAFGAIRIDGEPYWDGGIYSNTPIEAVLDDKPRRDSLIFAVNVWHQKASEPTSIWEVMSRQKDIQFASRADSHIARQKQIHRLRHVIRELTRELPAARQADQKVKELASWGCGTQMHVVHLLAPRLESEDHTKDIDFTASGIRGRRDAGHADTKRMIARAPWRAQADPIEGVIEHV
ncbi:MAG TPA: patatin-like phospholipase family protein [Caldimonas sp.]|nr:patatin-like phospholipase family protein [Caldimonas sp.]HEX4233585.1 patatin-like phospholipase family protein [Caldimonas sp.]